MPSKTPKGAWLVRLVSLLLVALVLILLGRTLVSGALGCARAFDGASYTDADELSQSPTQTPIPPMDMFSEDAYDRVYPDLVEPTLEPDA